MYIHALEITFAFQFQAYHKAYSDYFWCEIDTYSKHCDANTKREESSISIHLGVLCNTIYFLFRTCYDCTLGR